MMIDRRSMIDLSSSENPSVRVTKKGSAPIGSTMAKKLAIAATRKGISAVMRPSHQGLRAL